MRLITMEQLQQLTRIYNTLLEVQTKGENTFIMADSLRAFEKCIMDITKNEEVGEQPNAPVEG